MLSDDDFYAQILPHIRTVREPSGYYWSKLGAVLAGVERVEDGVVTFAISVHGDPWRKTRRTLPVDIFRMQFPRKMEK